MWPKTTQSRVLAALAVMATTAWSSSMATTLTDSAISQDKPAYNTTLIDCSLPGKKDPSCSLVQLPDTRVKVYEVLSDGSLKLTNEVVTRAQLATEREDAKKKGLLHSGSEYNATEVALEKRVPPTPECRDRTAKWYDSGGWGTWLNSWKQVGGCYYYETYSINKATSSSVQRSFTSGITGNLKDILQGTFSYTWGSTVDLGTTFTCTWGKGSTYGSHSVWFQPLTNWHTGWPNWQLTQTGGYGCPSGVWHEWEYTRADYPVTNGNFATGNWGCDSGCQGRDHR